MFIGRFGVGFGATRAAPGKSLGTLFLAALIAMLAGQAPARQRIAFARAFPNPGQETQVWILRMSLAGC